MALAAISRDRRALLVTGEESTAQVKLRAARLGGAEQVEILAETNLEAVCATLERERPDVCVIDSVQTLYSAEIGSAPGLGRAGARGGGSPVAGRQGSGVALFLVGHVTKDGSVAGPRVLEHLVDCVLQFEGDRYHAHRVLRAAKNRFGSTNELGVFEMTGTGLQGVPDPSAVFGQSDGEVGAPRSPAHSKAPGRSCSRSRRSSPRPTSRCRAGSATGVDPKRLAMIVAVLSRHAGIALGQADVFVNVAGGVRIDEPGADLAVALAIASAAKGRRSGLDRVLRRGGAHRAAEARHPGRAPGAGVREARPSCGDRPQGHRGAGQGGARRGGHAPPSGLGSPRKGRAGGRVAALSRDFFERPVKKWRFPATFAILDVVRRRSSTRRRLNENGQNGRLGLVQGRRQGRVSAPRSGNRGQEGEAEGARRGARVPTDSDPAQRHDGQGADRERRPSRPPQGHRRDHRRAGAEGCAEAARRCRRTGTAASSTTATR